MGAHRPAKIRRQPYSWLGAGAVTLGLGAAIAGGTGVAHGSPDHPAPHPPPAPPHTAPAKVANKHFHSGSDTAGGSKPSHRDRADKNAAVTRSTPAAPAPVAASKPTARPVIAPAPAAAAPATPTGGSAVATTQPVSSTTPAAAATTVTALPTASTNTALAVLALVTPLLSTTPSRRVAAPLAATVSTSAPVDTPAQGTVTVGTPNANGVITGSLGFTDPAGKALSYSVTGKPGKGSVTVTTAGVFTYTPTTAARQAAGATLDAVTDQFTITAKSTAGGTNSEIVTVPVSPIADVPKAATLTVGTPSTTSGMVTGKLNITDPQKLALTYNVTTEPAGGTVAVTSTGAFTYTPTLAARQDAGTRTAKTTNTFTVTATNTVNQSVTETVTVTVSPILDKPLVGTPTLSAPGANGAVTGALGITDPQNLALTYTATKPAKGTVTFTGTGGFTYTPTQAARIAAGTKTTAVTDTFTVTAKNAVSSVTEKVTVTIDPIPDVPTAGTFTVGKPNATTGVITGSVAITDPQKLKLTYSVTTVPADGKLVVSTAGAYTYTPTTTARIDAALSPTPITDTFAVTATNTVGNTVTQTITVTVPPLVDVPKAATPSIGAANATTGTITGAVKFTDPQKLPLTYTVATQPVGGTVVVTQTGAFTYTPDVATRQAAGATKAKVTATFVITAANAVSSTNQTITVTVSPIPDQPIAGGAVATTTSPTGTIVGNLNITDPQNLALTYTTTTKPAKGSVTYSAAGTFTYVPTAATLKSAATAKTPLTDTFTVSAVNTVGLKVTEKVAVTIVSSTDFPVAGVPYISAADPTSGKVTGAVNFTDASGSALTYTVSTNPAHGQVSVSTSGQFTYTPTQLALSQATASSIDTFAITAVNAVGNRATATIAVPIGAAAGTATPAALNAIGFKGSPIQVVAAPSGTRAYVLTSQTSGSSTTYALATVDTNPTSATFGTVVSTLDLSKLGSVNGLAINAAGTQIYATANTTATVLWTVTVNSSISVIDTTTNAIKTISTGTGFVGLPVVAGNTVYIPGGTLGQYNLGFASTLVKVFNPVTNTFGTSIAIPTPTGTTPAGVNGFAVSPDGTKLYVATATNSSSASTVTTSEVISVINTSTNTVANTFSIANNVTGGLNSVPQLFVADNSHLYTVGPTGSLTTFNPDGTIAGSATLPGSGTPTGAALSPDGKTLYVSTVNTSTGTPSSQVLVVNTATGVVTSTIADTTAAGTGSTAQTAAGLVTGADGTLYLVNSGTAATGPTTTTTFGNVTAIGTAATKVVPGNGGVYDVPIAGTATASAPSATTGAVTGTVKFTDPANQALTFSVTAAPAKGTVIVSSTGTFTYTPADAATNGTDTFTVTATNAAGNTATQSVSVTVTVVPDVPSAPISSTPGLAANGVVTGTVTATDPKGKPLTYSVTSSALSGSVTINSTTGVYTYTPTAQAMQAVGTGGAVVDRFTVTVSNGTGNTSTATIVVPIQSASAPADAIITTGAYGSTPGFKSVAISPNGATAYVSGAGGITVINTATNAVIATIPFATAPIGLAVSPNGQSLYAISVNAGGGGLITVINTATRTTSSSVGFSGTPTDFAVNPNGSTVYLTTNDANGNGTVSVINASSYAVSRFISLGTSSADHVTVSPDGGAMYVSSATGNTVAVINTATNIISGALSVTSPRELGVSPDNKTLYVTTASGAVAVINTATNTVVATITTPGTDYGSVAFSPDGSYAYVLSQSTGGTGYAVSVISTATNTIVATIPAYNSPTDISVNPSTGQLYITNAQTVVVMPGANSTAA